MLDMPKLDEKPWLVLLFDNSTGDMIYFNVFGQPFLILGTLEKAQDLLERRSAKYSSRLNMPMLTELMDWKKNLGFMPMGKMWRDYRKAFDQYFHANVTVNYQPTLLRETHQYLKLLLDTPNRFESHTRHTFMASMMSVIYGVTVEPDSNNDFISLIERALRSISDATVPGTFLVDFFPVMKYIPAWFPGASFQRQAREWRKLKDEVVNAPFDHVKRLIRSGDATTCMLTSLIDAIPDGVNQVDEEEKAKELCSVAFGAGADTTVSVMQSFFLAMAMHPDVMRKAQRELDEVLGVGRLPDFSDRPLLPYVNALIKECLRWNLVTNIGFAHMSSEDDEYHGFFIPKGTVVMANTWAILHDPEVFEHSNQFMPERYLKDGQLDPSVRDPGVAAFGFGRRICPGQSFVDLHIYSLISSTLAAFDILAPLDHKGNLLKLEARYTSAPLSVPLPFECRILPRSPAMERIVQESSYLN
ncbi:cytochrome P450 [Panaeolus papilionaceus]|nr:cytochrome P450 [Panaeolus papilionaceus]